MTFDFDQVFDRHNTGSTKWSRYPADVLPMWVADMDFAAPPAVLAALQQRIGHGVFGYGGPWPSLTESVLAHLQGEYGWSIEPEWLVWLPGLVSGLNIACRAVDGEVLTGALKNEVPDSDGAAIEKRGNRPAPRGKPLAIPVKAAGSCC